MATPKRIHVPSEKPPAWLKIRIWAGSILYHGRNEGGRALQVFRLPGRRIAKLGCSPNELAAMEYVSQRTKIPIPKIYRIYDYALGQHIVMEEVAGGHVGVYDGQMTPEQIRTFGHELSECLKQLRSLEPPSPGFIGSVSLASNIDHRLSGTPFGPFSSIMDFHTYLRRGRPLTHWENEPDVVRVHATPEKYCVKFSHAELNPHNIMVKDGHITAIIDWEFAGWYPEYWDYTKMHWCPRLPLWDNFYKAIENEDGITKYPAELAAEQAIWKRMHPWSYDDPPWQPSDDEDGQTQEGEDGASRKEV